MNEMEVEGQELQEGEGGGIDDNTASLAVENDDGEDDIISWSSSSFVATQEMEQDIDQDHNLDQDFEEEDYDGDGEDDTADLQIKSAGWKPEMSSASLSEESKALLLWRLDKEESFSDWTIEVTFESKEGGTKKDLYHVNRSVLAAGPKKSNYFEALFKGDQFRENLDCTSCLSLSEEVANVFPTFLDYMYSQAYESRCLIKYDNCISLKYLGDYYIVPKLTEDIMHFIQQDMYNLEHVQDYLSEFSDMDDDMSKRILRSAATVCCEMIFSITAGSSLLQALPPSMFLHIISTVASTKRYTHSSEPFTNDQFRHICQLVVDYVKHRREDLNELYFQNITSWLKLPDETVMAGLLAIDFLEVIKLTGWKGSFSSMRDMKVVLSGYLANMPTESIPLGLFSSIVEKCPCDVTAYILMKAVSEREALREKLAHLKRRRMS